MKILKNIIRFLIYYMIGYLIYNLAILLTQFIVYAILKIPLTIITPFIDGIGRNLYTYTIVYVFIYMVYFIYNIILVNVLNKKLNKIKKEGNENEK